MPIEDISYTTKPSAESDEGYITVIAPDGTQVSRHRNFEECSESAVSHANSNDLDGDLVYRFIPPEKHMRIKRTSIVLPTPITQTISVLSGVGDVGTDGSVPTVSATTLPTGDNATRISNILAGRAPHFTYNNPADPVTTRQVTVNSASEFNAQSAIAGTQITVGSSFSGNVRINADDIDVIMDNSLTITGNLTIGADFGQPNISRIRWTGGNVGTTYIHRCDDVLMDDFYALANAATSIESYPKNAIGTFATVNRVFSINSTYHLDGPNVSSGLWQWTMTVSGFPGRSDTVFFGNVKFSTNEFAQNNRFQGVNKLMIVDSVMNPNLLSGNGARFHETSDVWVRDTWRVGGMLNQVTASSPAPSVANGLFDNFDAYGDSFYATTDATNTGTVQNTTLTHTTTASFGVFPPYTDGGGNSVVTGWDGVTLPDASGVGAIRP